MKRSNKIAAVLLASLGLGLAVAGAHAESMGGAMGHEMRGGMMHGMHGMHGAKGHGEMGSGMGGHGEGQMAGQQLMTPEERKAMHEKMRNAATPEERQKLAEANRAEMQKRAKVKGVTLPETHGGHHRTGPNAGEHKH